jgi:uncharacterized protein (DUF302 family)
MSKTLSDSPAACEVRVRAALTEQGFGVLTEIDLEATLRAKLGAEVGAYKILGACNPAFAKGALDLEPRIGLMLPCNVVLRAVEGGTEVSVIDPVASMTAVDNPPLLAHAQLVKDLLGKAFESMR